MAVHLNDLESSVAAGEVALSPNAVEACVAACDAYIEGLLDLRMRVMSQTYDRGFGILPSGVALAAKYGELGSTMLPDVLTQHMEVAKRLRDTFVAAGCNYSEADAHGGSAILAAGERG